ncbi:carbohydrate ABC transporter substrate-binding protein (CUT1 family) [Halanaerobium saccharolyticum]|uniref:Carbohydrate ABC transporter substrate-binding protein (CUT1 family) n=1 Tax=Halanaerobium saccharolyticum TaxID=43595 RepID=A0A4R7Z4Y6_9FIRM|nr:extracellular solute-binding protein [Halanaerobium saccharolyticum]RAK12689.1 carbohydrate ABC transporter substrate-binding protein (CUT1 family) [Halanaerobium saccharolyticum]TDW05399.1 carbohydrate ABC transporter substrate-binding protein (CUT1 family) [Halanaerobium saccharolyticum]TDX62914.1 carbohydrate ABC transporter substrate-binding protein (CUT1 family) [Halanaerobium saccharolyticum]
MRKNKILTLILLTVLILTLTTAAFAQTTVEYWTTQTEENRVEIINNLIDRFEAQQDEYKIELVTVQENDIPTKLAAGMAAGRLPAMIEVGAENILKLGAEGMLDSEAVNDVVNSIGEDDLYDGALKMLASPEGGYFGVPFHGWVQGIWYREDLFEEKGLEPPTTWESIMAAAKEFHDPGNQKYGIVVGTNKDSYARQTFTQFALSNNARIFDENGNLVFNSPEMVETLEYYAELAKYTPPGPNGWRDARDLFLAGRVPMMMYSTYIMDDIGLAATDYAGEEGEMIANLVDKTNFANTMKNKSEAVFGQISGFTFIKSKDQKKIEGAKAFAEFLMTGENYIEFLHMAPGGMNAVRPSIANDPKYLEHELLEVWGEKSARIASGLNSIGKFGYVGGKVFPEIGNIASQFIVGQTIMKMTESGWSAERAAEWGQKEMEDALE